MDFKAKGLKEAGVCHKCYKKIKSGAVGSLIFGAIAMFMGFGDFSEADIIVKFFSLLLMLLGLFLLVEGLIALIKPSPEAYILEGIAFILVGLWNVFVGVLSLIVGQPQAFFIILGVWQVVLGIGTFKEAKEFQKAINQLPDKSLLKTIDELVKQLLASKPKQSEEFIEFTAGTFTKSLQWKGKIAGDTLVLYSIPDENLRFLKQDEIELENKGKVMLGNDIKIDAKIMESPELQDKKNQDGLLPDISAGAQKSSGGVMVKYSGTIPPESYERIVKWKETPVLLDSAKDSEKDGENPDGEIIKAPF